MEMKIFGFIKRKKQKKHIIYSGNAKITKSIFKDSNVQFMLMRGVGIEKSDSVKKNTYVCRYV